MELEDNFKKKLGGLLNYLLFQFKVFILCTFSLQFKLFYVQSTYLSLLYNLHVKFNTRLIYTGFLHISVNCNTFSHFSALYTVQLTLQGSVFCTAYHAMYLKFYHALFSVHFVQLTVHCVLYNLQRTIICTLYRALISAHNPGVMYFAHCIVNTFL